jgi:hypothetical protein
VILGHSLSLELPVLRLYTLMIINLSLSMISSRAATFKLYYLRLYYAAFISRLIMKYTLAPDLALYANL